MFAQIFLILVGLVLPASLFSASDDFTCGEAVGGTNYRKVEPVHPAQPLPQNLPPKLPGMSSSSSGRTDEAPIRGEDSVEISGDLIETEKKLLTSIQLHQELIKMKEEQIASLDQQMQDRGSSDAALRASFLRMKIEELNKLRTGLKVLQQLLNQERAKRNP